MLAPNESFCTLSHVEVTQYLGVDSSITMADEAATGLELCQQIPPGLFFCRFIRFVLFTSMNMWFCIFPVVFEFESI